MQEKKLCLHQGLLKNEFKAFFRSPYMYLLEKMN